MSQTNPKTLIYGVFQADELAFIPKRQALELAQLPRTARAPARRGDALPDGLVAVAPFEAMVARGG